MEVGRLPSQEAALRDAHEVKRREALGGDSSRRSLLLIMGTAICSGVAGYILRGSGAVSAASDEGEGEIDYRILWARRMASEETPIEELLQNADAFVLELMARSFDDPLVWIGAERICVALYEDASVLDSEVRQRIASYLASTIRAADPPGELEIERFLPTLDRLSR